MEIASHLRKINPLYSGMLIHVHHHLLQKSGRLNSSHNFHKFPDTSYPNPVDKCPSSKTAPPQLQGRLHQDTRHGSPADSKFFASSALVVVLVEPAPWNGQYIGTSKKFGSMPWKWALTLSKSVPETSALIEPGINSIYIPLNTSGIQVYAIFKGLESLECD